MSNEATDPGRLYDERCYQRFDLVPGVGFCPLQELLCCLARFVLSADDGPGAENVELCGGRPCGSNKCADPEGIYIIMEVVDYIVCNLSRKLHRTDAGVDDCG